MILISIYNGSLLANPEPTMARNKRIFISFGVEDKFARDNLVYQAKRQHNAPFDFTDMSVKFRLLTWFS
jgi:hypothetical protein